MVKYFTLRLSVRWWLPLLCALLGLTGLLLEPAVLQTLRNAQFDGLQRVRPRVYVPAPVRIVDIDEASLARLGQWPWPRTQLAELVTALNTAGVAAIGFDVLLAEPDRTSPASMAALWHLPGPLAQKLQTLPDHDAALASAIQEAGVVLATALQAGGNAATPAGTDVPYKFVQVGPPALTALHGFGQQIMPIATLAKAASGLGAITFIADGDGVVRRVPLVLRLGGQPVPSLVAEMLRVGQGAKTYILKSAPQAGTGMQELRIGALSVPTTAQGEVWVHYARDLPARSIPAWQVLAGQVDTADLQGSLVLVGSTAQGLMDLRASPLGHIMPGVEAHAQALEQILSGGSLQRPAWAQALEALVLAAACLVVGTLAMRLRILPSTAVVAVVLWGLVSGAWVAFAHYGLLLDALSPAIAVLLTFVLCSLVQHRASEREQRWVKEAFSRYVSPNRVQHLMQHHELLELGGKRQTCSFVFTDLEGFTSLMEHLDPAQAVSLLNTYLDQMVGIAFAHGGTLDRIVGDAVAIMFSAPEPQADHCQRALDCALAMHRFASAYAQEQTAQGQAFGGTRIGVHSGEVIVGNFGGNTMFDYRALGDVVNTAARLESVNKQLGTWVCVSAATLAGCSAVAVRPVGCLVLKGKQEALEVFEPVTAAAVGVAPLDDYLAAYQALTDAPDQALLQWAALASQYPRDALLQFHLQRLRAGAVGNWVVMEQK